MEKFQKVFTEAMALFEMDSASVLGTTPHTAGQDYQIDYAPGDARIPKVLGAKKGKRKGRRYPFIQKRNMNFA